MIQAVPSSSPEFENPAGIIRLTSLEIATCDPAPLQRLLDNIGFTPMARHMDQNIVLYSNGEIDIILNNQPNLHGLHLKAIGFHVDDATKALQILVDRGAVPDLNQNTLYTAPAVQGNAGTLVYLLESSHTHRLEPLAVPARDETEITCLDHLTYQVTSEQLERWTQFLEKLFNFHQQRSQLSNRLLKSPCGFLDLGFSDSTSPVEGLTHIGFKAKNLQSIKSLLEHAKAEINLCTNNRIESSLEIGGKHIHFNFTRPQE